MALVSFLSHVKRAIVGAPIPSHRAQHERFSRTTGLAVLSSDALSSVAYATEEILRVLAIGGSAALALVTPIGGVIAALLAIVAFSYRQTIEAYPDNGGSYIVAKDNLGANAGLLAASALMIDYVLNVAVGISAGIGALTSAIPQLHPYTLELCLSVLTLITIVNLRGTLEAGLQYYNGAFADGRAQYAQRVMAERERLLEVVQNRSIATVALHGG